MVNFIYTNSAHTHKQKHTQQQALRQRMHASTHLSILNSSCNNDVIHTAVETLRVRFSADSLTSIISTAQTQQCHTEQHLRTQTATTAIDSRHGCAHK
jgi:hypothetical protein